MTTWLLSSPTPGVRFEARHSALHILLDGVGDLTAANGWPPAFLASKRGKKIAIQANMALEMGLAEGDSREIRIPYHHHRELQNIGLDLLTSWTQPSPYLLYIQSSGSLGLGDFRYIYHFYLGAQQVPLMRVGIYVRRHPEDTPLHLDPQTYALVEAMDAFNATAQEESLGGKAWLTFSTIKGCAKEVGAQLDAYLASNDVVVPSKIGLTVLEERDGALTFLPNCEGLPEEGLTRAFRNSRDGQDLYTLQGDQGARIRVVMGEGQRAILDRMRKVRKMKGDLAQRLKADPTLAFEGYLDILEPAYARRVQGIGDWKPQSLPHAPTNQASLLDADGVDLDSVEAPVDLAWPRLNGSIETPTRVKAETYDTHASVEVPLETPHDAEAFVQAMREAQRDGAPSFIFQGHQLELDPQMLEDLEEGEGPQRPRTKKFLLIYTDEEAIEAADEQEVTSLVDTPHEDLPLVYDPPRALLSAFPLKAHQEQAVAWLQRCLADRPARRGALLGDEMGLGKTLEVLAFAAWCLEQGRFDGFDQSPGPYRPMLIVAPLMLVENETWQQDIAKFFVPDTFGPVLSLTSQTLPAFKRYRGQETEIGKPLLDLDAIRRHRIVITNYDTLTNYQHSFAQLDGGRSIWSLLVTDEAQNFKTPNTRTSHAIKALHPDFHVACTGTPVENRLLDIWNLFDALQPALLGSAREFKATYETPLADVSGTAEADQTSGAEAALQDLRRRLKYQQSSAFLLRREKAILPDFPPKRTEFIACDMDASEVDRHIELLKALSTADRRKGVHLSCLHRLVLLYQHPKAEESDFEDLSTEELIATSSKLRSTVERIETIRHQGEKVILFARHHKIQAMLAKIIAETFGIPVDIINGATSAQGGSFGSTGGFAGASRAHRSRILDTFRARPGFQALVLSPFVAGVGLTITEANHVIHYGRWWNPAVESQATDRVYRIGQLRPVVVHLPMLQDASGRLPATLDERLHQLLERKQAMARDFLSPGPSEKTLERDLYKALDEDLAKLKW